MFAHSCWLHCRCSRQPYRLPHWLLFARNLRTGLRVGHYRNSTYNVSSLARHVGSHVFTNSCEHYKYGFSTWPSKESWSCVVSKILSIMVKITGAEVSLVTDETLRGQLGPGPKTPDCFRLYQTYTDMQNVTAWALDSLLASVWASYWVGFLQTLLAGELGTTSVPLRTSLSLVSVSGAFQKIIKNLTICLEDCEMSLIGQVQQLPAPPWECYLMSLRTYPRLKCSRDWLTEA